MRLKTELAIKADIESLPPRLRLVCLMETGGKLAIWGSDENRQNIDLVLKKGMPCTVECDYIEPAEWALVYGHSHWVPEHRSLRIVESGLIDERTGYVQ